MKKWERNLIKKFKELIKKLKIEIFSIENISDKNSCDDFVDIFNKHTGNFATRIHSCYFYGEWMETILFTPKYIKPNDVNKIYNLVHNYYENYGDDESNALSTLVEEFGG